MAEEDEDDETCAKEADGAAKKKKNRKKKKNKTVTDEDGDGAEQGGGYQADDAPPAEPAPRNPLLKDEPWQVPEEDWEDITDMCNLAVPGMRVGEMIHSPHFRLLDAMSAIEIMDPKMDSGYNNSADMTLERALESGIILPKMSHEEFIGICDQLLMYFMLWLEGHTIVQTVFCCLYLHDLERCVKPVPLLGAFIDAFLLACRKARAAVWSAGVFDDEDFVPSVFTFDLEACAFSTKQSEVIDRIKKECKSLSQDASPLASEVAARLQFMGDYALALGELVAPQPVQPANGKKIVGPSEAAAARLTSCLKILEQLKADASKRGTPPESAMRSFDVSVNKHLLVPGPPRTVEPVVDLQVAFSTWLSHVNELLLCAKVSQKNLVQLLQGCFIQKDQPPNVLPRSVAQLRGSEGKLLKRLMLDSLEMHLFPSEALQHCKKYVDDFLERSEALFAHLLKLAHANSARRFRRLAHVFPDFNQLQHEAWQLDEELKKTFGANLRHPRPCWLWIMEHTLQAMLSKLLLGFELDLYDEAEYHMIYWYVDYLYGLRIYNLNELYHAKEQPVGGVNKKGPKRPPPPQKGGQRPRNPPPVLLLLEATQNAVRGLFRLLAFCLRRKLMECPAGAQEGLPQRFVLRFRSLEHFRLPHLPSYHDFQQSAAAAQAQPDSLIVLEAAQASFGEAAQFLEKFSTALKDPSVQSASEAQDGVTADNSKALKRVIVANQLAITLLLQGLKGGKEMTVVADATHHPNLLSIKVSTKAPAAAEAEAVSTKATAAAEAEAVSTKAPAAAEAEGVQAVAPK